MQETQDTRFIPDIRPTTKFSYVSIEVPTKGWVSLDHKPPRTITKIKFGSSLANPHEGEGNTNFLGLTITLVAPRGHLVCIEDESSRVMNTQRSFVKCSCLKVERATQDLAQIYPRRLVFD
jgi:hypothetical protein